MNEEQKQYIENNIDLIEHNRWEEFFENAPSGIGGVLYEAGIDFMTVLEYVPPSSFARCSNITSITIPDGITNISKFAFYYCESLTSVTIPDSVTSIDWCAFEGCKSLDSIKIPHRVTSIDNSAFENCKGLTSITIPDSVTIIGFHAFKGCSKLTSVTIGKGVKRIIDSAFVSCKNLTSINFNGTKTQWKAIQKDRIFGKAVKKIICTDGVIDIT